MTVDFLAKAKGLEVTFRDLSTDLPEPGTFRHQWDFGDGSPFSFEQNPTHIYEELGEYDVTLSIALRKSEEPKEPEESGEEPKEPEEGEEPNTPEEGGEDNGVQTLSEESEEGDGDGTEEPEEPKEENPEEPGEEPEEDPANFDIIGSFSKVVKVSDKVRTMLSGSIYNLIDTYIPANIFGTIPASVKQQFIEKWQLYLQPIVNHCIPVSEYNNELYYEALENQLIMELAAYDFILNKVQELLGYTSSKVVSKSTLAPEPEEIEKETIYDLVYELIHDEETDTYTRGNLIEKRNPREIEPWCKVTGYKVERSEDNTDEIEVPIVECGDPQDYYSGKDSAGGSVKKIVTGPTEVEYFDENADNADLVNYAYNALKPGGFIDIMKQNICMLAERVQVYLPICPPQSRVVTPRVVNRRRPGPLSGPDPYGIIV